jgi:hypothetical protein
MKTILLGSSSSIDGIKKIISDYFFSNSVELKPKDDPNGFDVYTGMGHLPKFQVIKKGNKFRFELIK